MHYRGDTSTGGSDHHPGSGLPGLKSCSLYYYLYEFGHVIHLFNASNYYLYNGTNTVYLSYLLSVLSGKCIKSTGFTSGQRHSREREKERGKRKARNSLSLQITPYTNSLENCFILSDNSSIQ